MGASSQGWPGWIQGVHAWAGQGLVVLGLLMLVRASLGTKGPWLEAREYVASALAAAVVLASVLTGGILAWDQQGWESLRHVQAALGPLGSSAAQPQEADVGVAFWAHALVFPLILAGLGRVAVGRFEKPRRLPADAAFFFRAAASRVREGAPWLVATALLAWVWPPEHGPEPIAGIAVSKPDWPFLWLVPFQDWLGAAAGLRAGLGLAVASFAAFPWVTRHWTARRRTWLVLGAAGALGVLTVWGALA